MTEDRRESVISTIQTLRKRIGHIRQKGTRIGEHNTKGVLIDPLLSALGWDLADLDEVSREYRRKRQDNPVDYALFLLRSPILFVEAKDLDATLSDRKWIYQTLSYAVVVGVEWCALTNGDEYRLYNAHALVDAEEKLFRTVRISDANQHDATVETLELLSKEKMGENRLTVLWKAHFVDRRVKASLADLVGNQNESLIRLLHKKTSGLTPGDIKNSLKRADMRIEFPSVNLASLSSMLQPAKKEKTPPLPRRGTKKKTLTPIPGTMKELIEVGLIQPPLGLEVSYKKNHLTATVQHDGTISFDGKTYASLSVAGGMARNSVSGQPQDGRPYYQTNGWTFWKYHDPDTGKLEEIDRLRQLYVKRTR